MKMPVLETERLLLVPAHPRLAKAAAAFYEKNRDFLQPFEPKYHRDFTTKAYQKALLREDLNMASAGQGVRFWLFRKAEPGVAVGCVVLSEIVLGAFRSCCMAYKIDRDLLRQGYGAEAVNAAVDFAFRGLELHRVQVSIMPRNAASLALAKKCGFRQEGLSPRYICINGVWEDHIHLARLNEKE